MTTVNNFNVIKRNYLEKVKEYNQKYNAYTLKIEELENLGELLNDKIFELNKEYAENVKEPSWFNDVLQPLANEVKEKTKEETMSNFETYLLSYLENLNEFQDSTREVDLKIAECNAKIREVISQATTLRRERDKNCEEPSWFNDLAKPFAKWLMRETKAKSAHIHQCPVNKTAKITLKFEPIHINVGIELKPGDLSKAELIYLTDGIMGRQEKILPDTIEGIVNILR